MRKYTDSQILRTIAKECKKDMDYQHERLVELGRKKLQLLKKKKKLIDYLNKHGIPFSLDLPLIDKTFDNITTQSINHNIAYEHSRRILSEINDMRKVKVKIK